MPVSASERMCSIFAVHYFLFFMVYNMLCLFVGKNSHDYANEIDFPNTNRSLCVVYVWYHDVYFSSLKVAVICQKLGNFWTER